VCGEGSEEGSLADSPLLVLCTCGLPPVLPPPLPVPRHGSARTAPRLPPRRRAAIPKVQSAMMLWFRRHLAEYV
jgi:hypothetical protein